MSTDYWKETLSIALDEEGIKLNEDQLNRIADAIAVSHENYGMYRGHDCIPSLSDHKLREMQASHQRELSRAEDVTEIVMKSFARKLGVNRDRLAVSNGEVIFNH